jgi:hypothetical protein
LQSLPQFPKEGIVTPEKKPEQTSKPSSPATEGGRKAWTPKSPVEVVLEQIDKQQKRVTALETELNAEKTMLTKLLQAKKVLEAT